MKVKIPHIALTFLVFTSLLTANAQLTQTGSKVGINTTSPTELLHVDGSLRTSTTSLSGDGANSQLRFNCAANTDSKGVVRLIQGTAGFISYNTNGEGGFTFVSAASGSAGAEPAWDWYNLVNINRFGCMRLGQYSPQAHPDARLSVKGKIVAQSIFVTSQNWPDYVFKTDYKLTSLKEVEKYINENCHLEGIPTTEEVTEVGINVSEMNHLLLKKVEELTLYLIEQNKKIEQLSTQVESLKK